MINRIQKLEADLEAILGSFASSKSQLEISSDLLKILSREFGCELATFWKVDDFCLRPAVIWNGADQSADRLSDDIKDKSLSLSEGTAGHVWRSRRPIWSTDIALDMCLPRSLGATSVGLQGGIWFAVKTNRAVYGVIEMLSRRLQPSSEELLQTVEHLGIKLGRLFEDSIAGEKA